MSAPATAGLRGLAGKNVLITGAAKGQGFSHAKAFADAGCDIAALDITTPPDPDVYACATAEMLDATVVEIEKRGQRCLPLPCDIRDEDQVRSAVGKALDFFDGRIDVLCNNAGFAAMDEIHTMRSNVLNAIIDTNVKGTMYVTKHVVESMIGRRSGKIINTSSSTTGGAHAQLSHYVASKHAINGLTKCWAAELSQYGITVNAVCPTSVKPGTGQGSGMLIGLAEQVGMEPDAFYDMVSAQNMPGTWRIEPWHVSDAVLFLASDSSNMITGALLPVDGGQMSL